MKKALALLLVLVMAFSLVACTKETAAPAETKTDTASAGEYTPPENVTLIVPYAAGGAMDLGARLLAKHASKYTKANLIVTNIAGASGTVGPAEMLKYAADGSYICAMNPSPTYVATPDKPLTYDYMTDFARVAIIMEDTRTIVVPKDNGKYTTLEEFLKYANEHPGEVTIGCSGTMNDAYLTPYLLAQKSGADLTVVSYDGSAEAKSDMLGGHISALSGSYSEILPLLENDQIIVLCTAGMERYEGLPDVPTLTEKGYDVVFSTCRGYCMKAGTDQKIIDYWSNVIGQICADAEFLAEAKDMGFPIKFMDSATYDTLAAKLMGTYKEIFAEIYK